MLHRLDPPIDHILQPRDRPRHIHFLRRGVAGHGRRLIVRAEPEPSARIRLAIKTAIEAKDERKGSGDGRVDTQLRDRATERLDGERADLAGFGNPVCPGPGGIHQKRGLEQSGLRLYRPAASAKMRALQTGAATQHHIMGTRGREIVRMQGSNIDILTARLPDPIRPAITDSRHQRLNLLSSDAIQCDAAFGKCLQKPVGQRRVRPLRQMQGAPGCQISAIGQSIEGRAGERLHARPAIAFRPEGGGPSGAVVAGPIFGLQQQHAAMRGKRGGQARTRHPGANNRDVEAAHTSRRSRKSSIAASTRSRTGSASRSSSWAASSPNSTSSASGRRFASRWMRLVSTS